MDVFVAGGKLQGTEIAFLAKEAGWRVSVVDRNEGALASKLCDEFVHARIDQLDADFIARFDIVFPAIEDIDTLRMLHHLCRSAKTPFVFDEAAFCLSSSKRATDAFLAQQGVCTPPDVSDDEDWADGYLVKPDSSSGSKGVRRFSRKEDARAWAEQHPGSLCQVFLEGDVLSIEVVCGQDDVQPQVVTQVVVGSDFDCHRIVAPADVTAREEQMVIDCARKIGEAMQMKGIFDIEMILREGVPYVLEIDARMPSQTPIAVYYATGINLVVETARAFLPDGGVPAPSAARLQGCSILQHVKVGHGGVDLIGECTLAQSSALVRRDGLFGSDVALVGSSDEPDDRYATLIVCAPSACIAEERMQDSLARAQESASRGEDAQ